MSKPVPEPVPPSRSETRFEDYKAALTPNQAVVEANRCLFCSDAPCINACPTHIDIPGFIRKISTGNLNGSARSIFSANILGMSCARVCPVEVLCEGDCVYNHLGMPPIQIGRLQRHATDAAYAAGWRYFEAGPDSGKSVGLIGGGPASLAAAHALRVAGHAVTIYEAGPRLGGLNITGVAPYKMRADAAEAEAAWILEIGGVDLKLGVAVGRDLSWAELEARHDALFLGVGLGADRMLGLPGESLPGVHGAVDFIAALKLGEVSLRDVKSAVVVGGGNTAMDGVRELLGLGVPSVTLIYRKTEARMSGYAHEWAAARKAGASAVWSALPVAWEGEDRLRAVRCARLDSGGRAGEEITLPADLALLAIGQARLADLVSGLEGVQIIDGRVSVDEHGFTGRPGLYAGGDCANGGKEVVNAAAEGKAAAQAIDRFLREERSPRNV